MAGYRYFDGQRPGASEELNKFFEGLTPSEREKYDRKHLALGRDLEGKPVILAYGTDFADVVNQARELLDEPKIPYVCRMPGSHRPLQISAQFRRN